MAHTPSPPAARPSARESLPQSDTHSQREGGAAEPRLPHERDESSDSQRSAPRERMKQAHDDLTEGRMDTDRGGPMNEVYAREFDPPTEQDPATPSKPAR